MERLWLCGLFLLVHSVTDLRERKIYTAVLLTQAVVGMGLCLGLRIPWDETVQAAVPGLCCLLAGRLTEEKVGYGDGWMLVVCALFETPVQMWRQLAGACLLALFYWGYLALIRRAAVKELPFAPFLFLGCMGGLLYGV